MKAYLKLSIHGAYRRLRFNQDIRFSDEIKNLVYKIKTVLTCSLEQALKKDFPYQQFNKIELTEKIAEAGIRYDTEIEEISEKTMQILEDYPGIGDEKDRDPKQVLLIKQEQESSPKYFLDNSSLSKEQVETIQRKHKEEMKQKLKQQQLEF